MEDFFWIPVNISISKPFFANKYEESIIVLLGPPYLGSKVGIILKILIFFFYFHNYKILEKSVIIFFNFLNEFNEFTPRTML